MEAILFFMAGSMSIIFGAVFFVGFTIVSLQDFKFAQSLGRGYGSVLGSAAIAIANILVFMSGVAILLTIEGCK